MAVPILKLRGAHGRAASIAARCRGLNNPEKCFLHQTVDDPFCRAFHKARSNKGMARCA